MRSEIIDFYARKRGHIPKLIERRPINTTPADIELAAKKFFEDISEDREDHIVLKNGQKVKNISIAGQVFRIAESNVSDIERNRYQENLELLENSKKIIAGLNRDKEALERDRDLWETRHGKAVKVLNKTERELGELVNGLKKKHYRLKVWFVGSYAALIWAWAVYRAILAFQ